MQNVEDRIHCALSNTFLHPKVTTAALLLLFLNDIWYIQEAKCSASYHILYSGGSQHLQLLDTRKTVVPGVNKLDLNRNKEVDCKQEEECHYGPWHIFILYQKATPRFNSELQWIKAFAVFWFLNKNYRGIPVDLIEEINLHKALSAASEDAWFAYVQ